MLAPTYALSQALCITPAGQLLRVNVKLGTCYPVVGVLAYGPVLDPMQDVHCQVDLLGSILASVEPTPEPTPDLFLEAVAAEAGMGWLLWLGLVVLMLAALLDRLPVVPAEQAPIQHPASPTLYEADTTLP